MTDTQPTGGPDLARQVLRQARAAAKAQGTAPKTKRPVRRRVDRGSGRDPALFGGILEQLAIAYDWKRPTAGGTLMATWPELLGTDAARISPERYDADTRTLHVRPHSSATATWARWNATSLAGRLNDRVGAGTVAHVRVLPPGPPPAAAPAAEPTPAPHPPAPAVAGPQRSRADAPAGFHQAHAALEAGRTRTTTTADEQLVDRYFGDAHGWLREPQSAFTDSAAALEAIMPTGGNETDNIRQAAIKRARDERAGRAPAVPTAFQRTA